MAASGITLEELQLATRNHGMPLEALRRPITPVGLHYLLIHYDIPLVDPADWTLEIGGRVGRPVRLTLEELQALPAVEVVATMECAGNGRARLHPRPLSQPWLVEAVGTARWRGVALGGLLEEAEPLDDAVEVIFTGLDRGVEGGHEQRFQRSLSLADAIGGDAVLAYGMNGAPLPPQHGFPLRLVVPGWYGMTNVKWLASIELADAPFAGYQQARAYRLRLDEEDDGLPLERMLPRALMAPPGIPDFFSRERSLPPGPCRLEGRAWSGLGPVESVEVSVDGGATWARAELGDDGLGRWAWRPWSYLWQVDEPGRYVLCCRARDAGGNHQPVEPQWNVGGYANTGVQQVVVTVG